MKRLQECDDKFRKQLDQERKTHEQHIEALQNEKQMRIEEANNKVRIFVFSNKTRNARNGVMF